MYKVKIISIFPDSFPGTLGQGVIGKAHSKKIWSLKTIDPRKYTKDKHKKIDDTTAGGGPGMIFKPDIMGKAIDACYRNIKSKEKYPLIYLSPRGKPLTQKKVSKLSKMKGINLLCGRYEGIDQRLLDYYEIEELSIGDYILAGGELAAQVLVESIVRLLPGTLGHSESSEMESFNNDLLEYPQYTRPKRWKNITIPDVLLSGNHKNISKWRLDMSEKITKKMRPDIWKNYKKNKTSKK